MTTCSYSGRVYPVLQEDKGTLAVVPSPLGRYRMSPDAFAVHYDLEQWFEAPAVRHGDGTNVSLADGHCEYREWRGPETIAAGKALLFFTGQASNIIPETPESFEDLYWMQKGTSGRLGYTPSQR